VFDPKEFELIVESCDANTRLDLFVASMINACNRTLATTLIKNGIIRVEGCTKKPGYRIKAGDRISGAIPEPQPPRFEPEPLEIDVLFEDPHLIVINKKSGVVVHPAPGNYSGTLVNGLLYRCPDLKGIGDELRPGIVHRLDKDTSGVLIVAKHQVSHIGLCAQFKSREISKQYLAVVHGAVRGDSGEIALPIGRHCVDRKRMATQSRKPREALTHWKVRERLDAFTLLELDIKTGRTHQIRVHCSAINHPVVGDKVYGGRRPVKFQGGNKSNPESLLSVSRQMLHAWRIRFNHPITEKEIRIEAPIPEDMERLIMRLRSCDL